jgi:hypothetical protein
MGRFLPVGCGRYLPWRGEAKVVWAQAAFRPSKPKDARREDGGRGPVGLLAQSRLFVFPPLECPLPIYSPHSSLTANAPLSCCTAYAHAAASDAASDS